MKISKYTIGIFCAIGIFAVSCDEIDPQVTDTSVPDSRPYSINTDGYAYFRTPAMVITKNGTLLAFAIGGQDRTDGGNNDIVMRRSGDRGKSWDGLKLIRDEGEKSVRCPAPVYLEDTNRVVLLYCLNTGGSNGPLRSFVTYSDNEGSDWASEVEITESVIPSEVNQFGTGSGHGIVIQSGSHKGRLVVPCYVRLSADNTFRSMAIFSDDGGVTWTHGEYADLKNLKECTICELSDGRLLMNSSLEDSGVEITDYYRYQAVSEDGGQTWLPASKTDLKEPLCHCSIFRYGTGEDGKGILLFANPNNQNNRKYLTLRASFDDGDTWTDGKDVTEDNRCGYCDIAVFPDGEIALIYEFGYKNLGGIALNRYKLDDLK